MLAAAARAHKRGFESMLNQAAVEVSLYMPAAKTATAGNFLSELEGTQEGKSEDTPSVTTKVLFSTDYLRPEAVVAGDVSEVIALLGEGAERLDAVIRAPLFDWVGGSGVLLDRTKPLGATLFDKCLYVEYLGRKYKVTSRPKRTGLAPIGPYILWVGLTDVGE